MTIEDLCNRLMVSPSNLAREYNKSHPRKRYEDIFSVNVAWSIVRSVFTSVVSTMDLLYDYEEVLELEQPEFDFRRTGGVYFVIRNKQIIYIGKSNNVYVRVSDYKKRFGEDVEIKIIKKESPDILESMYIYKFSPNGQSFNNTDKSWLIEIILEKTKSLLQQ